MEMGVFGLFVNNLEIMVKFYRDIIWLETDWDGEPAANFESVNCSLVMYGRNDFENMLSTQFTYPKGLNGTMVIGFNQKSYDDVDKEYKRLMDLGVKVISQPTTNQWGQRACYVADPEGNLLEIGSFGA